MEEFIIDENTSYEEGIKQLNEIVSALERGGLSLNESIEYYEKGFKLADFCRKKLTEAKQKIDVLENK